MKDIPTLEECLQQIEEYKKNRELDSRFTTRWNSFNFQLPSRDTELVYGHHPRVRRTWWQKLWGSPAYWCKKDSPTDKLIKELESRGCHCDIEFYADDNSSAGDRILVWIDF